MKNFIKFLTLFFVVSSSLTSCVIEMAGLPEDDCHNCGGCYDCGDTGTVPPEDDFGNGQPQTAQVLSNSDAYMFGYVDQNGVTKSLYTATNCYDELVGMFSAGGWNADHANNTSASADAIWRTFTFTDGSEMSMWFIGSSEETPQFCGYGRLSVDMESAEYIKADSLRVKAVFDTELQKAWK